MQKKIYQKTWFKNTILISLPTIISAIGVIITIVGDMGQTTKNTMLFVIGVLLVILMGAVCFFSNQDDKIFEDYKKVLEEKQKLLNVLAHVENELKTSNGTITMFSEIFEKWSKNINSFSKNVITNKSVSDKAWDKIKYFDVICSNCKNMIMQYCNKSDSSKISVSFVLCTTMKLGNNNIQMIRMVAHSSPESARPGACKKSEKLGDSKYHYAELIREEYSDIEVAINNEEILKIFNRITRNTDLSKYCQYIALPIYCTSNKLLGVFQVVTKYDYIIESERVDLLKFAEEKLIPYSNLIVLVDKINKGLYVNPQNIQKEQ